MEKGCISSLYFYLITFMIILFSSLDCELTSASYYDKYKDTIGLVQFNVQSFPTLCDPMNHSTPGLPVHHQLPEITQTHVH